MLGSVADLIGPGGYAVLDGGFGTELYARGLEIGACPERWNLLRPETVRDVHDAYIAAGSQIVLTNSFGGNAIRLAAHGEAHRHDELNRAAATLAREAADRAGGRVMVAGSMGPIGAPGIHPPSVHTASFARQAIALTAGGVDLFWIKTMSGSADATAALDGVRSASDLPVVVTFTFGARTRTATGESAGELAAGMAALGVAAVGVNCGEGPADVDAILAEMRLAAPGTLLVAKPNAGVPELIDGSLHHPASPEDMAVHAERWWRAGARLIGGCCGTTPAHVAAMANALGRR